MRRIMLLIISLSICFMGSVTHSAETTLLETYTPQQFQQYWFSSRAELSRYSLEQARYGEIHKGDAVFIFVTETMNPYKQVKADRPGAEDIPVEVECRPEIFYRNVSIFCHDVFIHTGGFSKVSFTPKSNGIDPRMVRTSLSANES